MDGFTTILKKALYFWYLATKRRRERGGKRRIPKGLVNVYTKGVENIESVYERGGKCRIGARKGWRMSNRYTKGVATVSFDGLFSS